MEIDDVQKVMEEIEKMKQNHENPELVDHAVMVVKYKKTLNDQQLHYFNKLQIEKPDVAEAMVLLHNQQNLLPDQIQALVREAKNVHAKLIASKQVRFNLAQEAILNHMAQKDHKSLASFIRDTLLEKIDESLEDL
jgi:hypothetical protein